MTVSTRPPKSHIAFDPPILYFGNPVALISTSNAVPNSPANLAPISSVFFLGHTAILAFGSSSHTLANLLRAKECTINLPDASMAEFVNRLAKTTGRQHLPAWKKSVGYDFVADKWTHAGLTPLTSELVSPPRVGQCKVSMEGKLVGRYDMMRELHPEGARPLCVEIRIVKIWVTRDIVMLGAKGDKIDPWKWNPLIMSFQQLLGLELGKPVLEEGVGSRLAEIEEESYRGFAKGSLQTPLKTKAGGGDKAPGQNGVKSVVAKWRIGQVPKGESEVEDDVSSEEDPS